MKASKKGILREEIEHGSNQTYRAMSRAEFTAIVKELDLKWKRKIR